jgi:putative PEP-CTERM system histidine kinase
LEQLLNLAAITATLCYILIAITAALRFQSVGYPIVPALLFTSVWSSYGATTTRVDLLLLGFWATSLLSILNQYRRLDTSKLVWAVLWSVPVVSLAAGTYFAIMPSPLYLWALLYCCVGTLVITEQVVRTSHRYIRAVGIGLATLFLFELYIVARIAAADSFSNDLLHARVLLNAVIALFLLVVALFVKDGLKRARHVTLSRPMAFTTTSLLVAGGLVTFVAIASYLLDSRLSKYQPILQPFLFFGFVLLLGINLRSSTQRAKIRVWINKNFFKTKFDYNIEWQKLTHRLSSPQEKDFGVIALNAIMPIYQSNASVLFLAEGNQLTRHTSVGLARQASTINLLEAPEFSLLLKSGWVFVTQNSNESILKENVELPDELLEIAPNLLVIPLLSHDSIIGMAALVVDPRLLEDFDWEDIDLLGMVGKQTANFVAYRKLSQENAIRSQFEIYHQLSTFVMHDLKNLIAQQMLVVQNAARFKDNPEFVSDAIVTIENSIKRMNRLMLKINKHSLRPSDQSQQEPLSLAQSINIALIKVSNRKPVPSYNSETDADDIVGESDAFIMALTHLLTNAQDACSDDDDISILVRLGNNEKSILCTVTDTGSGMDQDFIENRLFKPFDSTKKTVGMGIGAYQSQEIVSNMGGQLSVDSTLGEGTCFTIHLPLAKPLES